MAEPREDDNVTVSACPLCGTEKRAYKCECESPPANPVWMPRIAAERLRYLHRKAFPPQRLTATPAGAVTVWVEGDQIRLRPCKPMMNYEAVEGAQDGWTWLTPAQWVSVRNCVDEYVEAARKPKLTPMPRRADGS